MFIDAFFNKIAAVKYIKRRRLGRGYGFVTLILHKICVKVLNFCAACIIIL